MVLRRSRWFPLSSKRKPKRLPPVVLVFGEDPNDSKAVAELARALRDDLPHIQPRRRPQVLVKGREKARARKSAADIAHVVHAESKARPSIFVLAHEDCDAIEPAHTALADRIERHLKSEGVDVVAVTPAWEIEAWWFLWPRALASVNPRWRDPGYAGKHVGLIKHAKETLRRAVRPSGKHSSTRDYHESDSVKIAEFVRTLGLVDAPEARSDSFQRFARELRNWGAD